VLLDPAPPIADDEVEFIDSDGQGGVEDVLEDRAPADRQHRLRPVSGQGAEPLPLARGEDDRSVDRHTTPSATDP